jgi:hypothetical protein
MEVDLVRVIPSPAVIPATLKMVCNLGPAGLLNFPPKDEGVTVDIPSFGLTFVPSSSTFGVGAGVTVFSLDAD